MKRGDFVTMALQGDFGKPRPALVIQSDNFDDTPTTTVLPISSSLREAPFIRISVKPDKRNTILIDKHELLMAAAEMTPPPAKNMQVHRSKGEIKALHHHLEATERRLDVSEQRLDKAEFDGRNLRAEVTRLQEALAAKTERIHALELELNGGVRGLLRRINPLR